MWVLIGEKQCAFSILGFIESQKDRHGFSSLILQEVQRKLKLNISLGLIKERKRAGNTRDLMRLL